MFLNKYLQWTVCLNSMLAHTLLPAMAGPLYPSLCTCSFQLYNNQTLSWNWVSLGLVYIKSCLCIVYLLHIDLLNSKKIWIWEKHTLLGRWRGQAELWKKNGCWSLFHILPPLFGILSHFIQFEQGCDLWHLFKILVLNTSHWIHDKIICAGILLKYLLEVLYSSLLF